MPIKNLLLTAFSCFSLASMYAQQTTDSVKVFNAGVNGNNTVNLLARIDKDVLEKDPDLVILMVGTNDMMNINKTLSMQAYENNYQQLVVKIKAKADLILMTIPPVYMPYVLDRKPQFNNDSSLVLQKIDSANLVIRKMAAKNKCILVDLNKILLASGGADTTRDGIFQNEANIGIADGIHPNANGYKVIASALYQTIITAKPNAKRIVCFGDSITCGYRMKGQGSTDGDTFPAVLNRMFNLCSPPKK
jgi:lysophospholipase L1-like esterase